MTIPKNIKILLAIDLVITAVFLIVVYSPSVFPPNYGAVIFGANPWVYVFWVLGILFYAITVISVLVRWVKRRLKKV